MAQEKNASPPSSPKERILRGPVFSQPEPTPDPQIFRVRHASDSEAYRIIDDLNKRHKLHAMPFPIPRGAPEPQVSLSEALGGDEPAIKRIEQLKQIVFHATGDCGSARGTKYQNEVTDKMVADFIESDWREVPKFCLLLGDIVYSFGEREYYYDQFYEPYRNYHAPIFAAAGNHDGMISPLAHAKSLDAYLRNFCSDPTNGFVVTAEAGGLSRTAQIQPGVFFTLEAPMVRILVFYSNTLEDPGVIADVHTGDHQLKFLKAALERVKEEKYFGALLFAHHHPPYAVGGRHSSSEEMRQQMDKICNATGVWPHAVLAGHAHSYQRFTRKRSDGTEIPYIVCGNGGHNVNKLHHPYGSPTLRAPQILKTRSKNDDEVIFERYDDINYGYLRIVVNPAQLRIEYHPATDGGDTKAPDDSVTIDLKSRMRTMYKPNDLGYERQIEEIKRLYEQQRR